MTWLGTLQKTLKARAAARTHLRARRDLGMTLIEIMLVLAIIVLIAGSIGVGVFSQYKKGLVRVAKANVKEIAEAVTQYMIDNNHNCPQSLDDLVAQKYLKKKIKDPWGKDFQFKCPGAQDSDGADIVSLGPDKQEGTPDDVKSWEQ